MKRPIAWTLVLLASLPGLVCAQAAAPIRPPTDDYVRPGPAEPLPAAIAAAVERVHAAAVAAHISFLAAPALDGRALATRGLDTAAEYAAASLALAGAAPVRSAGDDVSGRSYFQQVPLRQIARPTGRLTIETRRGDGTSETAAFASGVDCLFPEHAPEMIAAPVVFAGYGIREKAPARDDYRDLDVKGKVVAILGGLPPGAEWQTPDLVSRYGSTGARQRFAAKLDVARSLGARAVLAIERDESAERLAFEASKAAPTFYLSFDDEEARKAPLVLVSPRAGDALLASAGLTARSAGTGQPRAMAGVTATVSFGGEEHLVLSRNILGMIAGADPRVRDEAVVIGAHLDHLGRSGETMYPGADDNASGVAALIEIAKAFASSASRPRRTIVFAFWTGEEEGHLGSDYYVRHPLWPLERTSVYLNLDMIAHAWTSEEMRKLVADTGLEEGEAFLAKVQPADFIELGVADWTPDLTPVLARAARATGLALHFDRIDGKSGGSDYREFARRQRPFVRFFGNYFDGYHEPTDTPDRLDAAQVQKMARLALVSAWLFADQ